MLYPLVGLFILTQPAESVKLEASKLVTVRVGQQCVVTVTTNAKKVTWKTPPGIDALPLDGKRLAVWALEGTYRLTAMVPSGDDVLSTEIILTVTGPRPPPAPPEPTPTPTPPEPQPPQPVPVTSFRVFIVYEAMQTLPASQYGVIYGAETEKALNAACNIPNASAWRRTDKDADPATMPAGLKEVWAAAKPKITTTPCVVFQVNEKITIEALQATNAEQVAMIQKYREGK